MDQGVTRKSEQLFISIHVSGERRIQARCRNVVKVIAKFMERSIFSID
jgi:hypothetical protein